jgi:L-asparagine transporter-like permease
MTILGYSGFGWLPSLLYLLLIIVLGYRDQKRPETPFFIGLVQILILIVLIIHGILLYESIFNGEQFVFGFANLETFSFFSGGELACTAFAVLLAELAMLNSRV